MENMENTMNVWIVVRNLDKKKKDRAILICWGMIMGRKKNKKPKNWVNPQKGVSKTKDPLEPKDRERLLEAAKTIGTLWGLDAWKVCMVYLFTGMHTSVLSDVAKSRITVIDGKKIRWLRPKKVGSPAVTEVLLYWELKPWIEEFVHDVNNCKDPRYYWEVVRACGFAASLTNISPMSLRHTFAVILDDWDFTPAEICAMMNCSPRTVMRYTSRTRRTIERKLHEKGWTGENTSTVTDDEGGKPAGLQLSSREAGFMYTFKSDEDYIY